MSADTTEERIEISIPKDSFCLVISAGDKLDEEYKITAAYPKELDDAEFEKAPAYYKMGVIVWNASSYSGALETLVELARKNLEEKGELDG